MDDADDTGIIDDDGAGSAADSGPVTSAPDAATDPADATTGANDDGTASDRCPDDLVGSGIVDGPSGMMIQLPSVPDDCELERALDHICRAHSAEMRDLVLTSVETWAGGQVMADLNVDKLEVIRPYLGCFGNVFVGTVSEILLDDPYGPGTIGNADERWRWLRAAKSVAEQVGPWMNEALGDNWHWYISYEANLNAFTDTTYRNNYVALLQQHITDLQGVHAGVVSWSPTFWIDPSGLGSSARATLQTALTNTFDRVPVDWVLIQDHLGVQPSWTCDDALAYYDIVRAAGPNLASVQLNVEYFTVDAAGIRAGDPADLAARIACYRRAGASIGASFEYRYWYETHGH